MTNTINQFIGTLRPIKNRVFQGYGEHGGVIKVRREGTVKSKSE